MFFAALTSGISILEVPTATFMENFKLSRIKSAGILTLIISFFSVIASLSFGVLGNFKIFGKIVFDFMDVLSSNYLLPINALALCIIVGWLMKDKLYEVFNNSFVKVLLKVVLKYFIPVIFVLIICNAG